MADHDITATLQNGIFTYSDSYKGKTINGPVHHVRHKETIRWMSPSGDIRITFPHGCDPTTGAHPHATQNNWTNPATLVGHPPDKTGPPGCKFDVIINGVPDDPQIIFDDTGTLQDDGIFNPVADLDTIAKSASSGLGDVLARLGGTAVSAGGPKHDPDALFFPFGITSIEVKVIVGVVTVDITVQGTTTGK